MRPTSAPPFADGERIPLLGEDGKAYTAVCRHGPIPPGGIPWEVRTDAGEPVAYDPQADEFEITTADGRRVVAVRLP